MRIRAVPILSVFAWFILLVWLTPSRVIFLGDDFGYVDGIVRSLRSHRWMASDWLEPLNLPLTLSSVILFIGTDNFYLSTFGLNLFLSVVNLVLLETCLKFALLSQKLRWSVVFAVLLSPIWMHKAIEFTGVPLGITCMLTLWLSWQRSWHNLFFILVLLATLNRQSGLCFLAWPAVALFKQRLAGEKLNPKFIWGILFTLSLTFFACLEAPPAWARQLAFENGRANFSFLRFGGNIMLAMVILAGLRALVAVLYGERVIAVCRMNLTQPLKPMLMMVAGVAVVLGGMGELHSETFGLERFTFVLLMVATFSAAWLQRWNDPPSAEVVVFLASYVLLVSWRGRWWDYYFIEPLLVLMLVTKPPEIVPAVKIPWVAWAMVVFGLANIPDLKRRLEDAEAKTLVYELALREGTIKVNELSDAPFGFLAWKLFPITRSQSSSAALIDFLKFVEGARAQYSDGQISVNREGGRKSIHPSREHWALPQGFTPPLLPLDNAEWRAYIRRRPN